MIDFLLMVILILVVNGGFNMVEKNQKKIISLLENPNKETEKENENAEKITVEELS